MSTSSESDSETPLQHKEDCTKCPEAPCDKVEILFLRLNPDEFAEWGLNILICSCDNTVSARVQFKFNKKEMFFNLAAKFIQKVWKCSKLRALFLLKRKCEIKHERLLAFLKRRKKSFNQIQQMALDFVQEMQMKPTLFYIRKRTCGPTETDFDFVKYALEHRIKITILTMRPLPIEYYRLVVETFLSGRPMTRGYFLWLEQDNCFDFAQILGGTQTIHSGRLMSSYNRALPIRNYFHLKQEDEDPRVLSLAFTACIPPCKCVPSAYHFNFRWELSH